MKNADLLLMGGGDPYAEATHWLTVGSWTASGATYYGYDNGVGAFSPSTVGGYTVDLISQVASVDGLLISYLPDSYPTKSTKVTRLDTGVTVTCPPVNKYPYMHQSTSNLITASDLSKSIPLKIELV